MKGINQRLIDLYQAANHFGELLGMELSIQERGSIHYTMRVGEQHLATPRAAHGGAILSLVDATLGVAALSQVSADHQVVSTIELKTNFLRPCLVGDVLLAKGQVIHAGKRLLYVECQIFNQNEELVAKANGTFNAYPAERAFEGYDAGE
jgi:acyl-CoA thioesterase